MAKNFDKINTLTINGQNYDRTLTEISIIGATIATPIEFQKYTIGIDYTSNSGASEFGRTIGSRYPDHVGFGHIECEGTLTVTDAGLQLLQATASALGLPDMHYLGMNGQINMLVKYFDYAGNVKTDILEFVLFTQYQNGVNREDVIYSREIPLKIGKISIGNSTTDSE